MKRNNINRIFKLGLLSLLVAVIAASCVKSVDGYTDFTDLKPTVLIAEGGMQNFTADALLFPPDPGIEDKKDTTYFHVNYASTDVAPSDQVVEFAIDQAALDAYNALGGSQYAIFPDSIYEFTATSATILKGNNFSEGVPLVIHSNKVDPTKSYMLPISIKTAPAGSTISTNFKTIYYHLIGNPIAGLYNWDWWRWNNTTPTGPNTGGTPSLGGIAVFAPLDETTVEVASGYYIGPRYTITFEDSSGVLINFDVEFNADDIQSMKDGGVSITNGPNITTADPTTGTYEFWYTAITSSGPRYVIDKYYK